MTETRLRWSKTWPDTDGDYSAHDPATGAYVGRIYSSVNTTDGTWSWFFGARGERANSKQEAADALTKAWREATAAPKANAYLKAKGG